eukprot:SAG22_NODE_1014_length_6027_cov_3.998988_3_plen_406_part_00
MATWSRESHHCLLIAELPLRDAYVFDRGHSLFVGVRLNTFPRLDHDEPDPDRRFKIAEVRRCQTGPSSNSCDFRHFTLLASSDGLSWHVIGKQTGPIADRSTVFQDRFRQQWIWSIKSDPSSAVPSTNGVTIGRARAYWETADFFAAAGSSSSRSSKTKGRWLGIPSIPYGSPYGKQPGVDCPTPWTNSDELDPHLQLPETEATGEADTAAAGKKAVFAFRPELYALDGASYESLTVGLFTILQCKHADDKRCPGPENGHEFNSVFAGWSRDGFSFSRPPKPARQPLAALNLTGCAGGGAAADPNCDSATWNFEDSQSVGGGFAVTEDKLLLYVSGRSHRMQTDQTGLFFLRRDGFASLDARLGAGGGEAATMITKPLRWSASNGRHLFVSRHVLHVILPALQNT